MAHVINISNGGMRAVERTSAHNAYMAQVRSFNLLSEDEERQMLLDYTAAVEAHDEDKRIAIRNRLIEHNQRFIFAAARQYCNNNADLLSDLIGEATIGFAEGIENYDFSKIQGKGRLCSWAAFYVRRAINEYLRKNGSLIKWTSNPLMFHKYTKVRDNLVQVLKREPTDEELAEALTKEGINVVDMQDVRRLNVSSVDTFYDDEDAYNPTLASFNSATAIQHNSANDDDTAYIHTLITKALSSLSKRDQEIIKMLYGLNKECIAYSMDVVASHFGFSNERIRQIHVKALETMAKQVHRVQQIA